MTRLIHAHQDFLLPIGALADFQHVFYAIAHTKPARPGGGRHQHGFSHGLRSFPVYTRTSFLSVRRTVSVLMRSTIEHATSRSAKSFSVQLVLVSLRRLCAGQGNQVGFSLTIELFLTAAYPLNRGTT